MKVVAWIIGLAAFGGLIVLSVAGLTAAIGILVTGFAIVLMIALGSLLGGRATPDRQPYPAPRPGTGEQPGSGEDTGPGAAATDTPARQPDAHGGEPGPA